MSSNAPKHRTHRYRAIPFLALFIGSAISVATASNAVGKELLVVPIDADREALRRDDPVVRRVLEMLGQALIERNHQVTYDDWFNRRQQLGRRNLSASAEWIREARRKGNRSDAMIAVKTYELKDHRRQGRATRVEVRARIYTLPEGRVVFETEGISTSGAVVPPDCDRACIAGAITAPLEQLTQVLAGELSLNLPQTRYGDRFRRQAETPGLREYHITLDGFDRTEINKVERYLKLFSGYQRHDFVERGRCRHVIAYLTRVQRARLESNVRRMFRELKMRAVRLSFGTLRVNATKPGCAER